MTSRLPLALALTGLIGAGTFATAQLATAEQNQPSAQTQQSEATQSKEEFKPSAADRAAFMEARIAALHAGLALTPDQEKMWPPVETALRDLSKTRMAIWERLHQMRHDETRKTDPIAWLKTVSENQLARGEALKKLADAAAPLYTSLSDEQKHRLPILARAIRMHAHHFGEHEEMEHGPGWHHGHHEYDHDNGPDGQE